MKKLLLSIIVCVFSLGLFSPQVSAKSNGYKKNKYSNLVYEGVWFSQLTENQQMVYLKTIERLTMQLTRTGVANLDSSFLQYFLPYANAAKRINNGFIFDGANDGIDYDSFLNGLNVLGSPIDPGCSGRDQVCAPYLGMVCSGGTAKLACSPDSTPTCASRGSLDCLRTALSNCGMNEKGQAKSGQSLSSTEYCKTLDRVMRRGTENVEAHCSSGSRSAASYCRQAVARLQGKEIPDSPKKAKPPTGADCEKMIRTLGNTRDSGSGRHKGDTGAKNNSFWRNMTGFAQQACGKTVSSTMNVVGICDVGNMQAPGGGLERPKVNSYLKSKDAKGFQSCVDEKERRILQQRDDRLAELGLKVTSRMSADKRNRYHSVKNLFQKEIDSMKRSSAASGSCSISEKVAITDDKGQKVVSELELKSVMPLAAKIRNNDDLSTEETNRFIAATGMSPNGFRTAFCQPTDFSSFKKALQRGLSANAKVSGEGSIANLFQGQARVAHYKMSRCLGSLKSNSGKDGAGCRLHVVEDFNTLRCASDNFPILAVNRKSKRCVLVTGLNRRVTSRNEKGRATAQEVRLNIRTPSGTSEMKVQSEGSFAKENQLQEYRCDGDRSLTRTGDSSRCWMKPSTQDPSRAGESQAQDIEL